MMKLAWHVGLTESATERLPNAPALWAALRKQAAEVVNPGTNVEICFSRKTTLSTQPFMGSVNAFMVAQDVQRLEAEGFDGAMIAASVDSGVYEARTSVAMPVIGSTEAAMGFSEFVGRRVGVVCIAGAGDYLGYVRAIEGLADRYGYRGRFISHRPVRPLGKSWEHFFETFARAIDGDSDELASMYDTVCAEFARDGADVLLSGNQFMGAVMRMAGIPFLTPQGLPFIDNAAIGLKMLETLVSLRRTMGLNKSEAGDYRAVAKAQVDSVSGWFAKR